MPKDAYWFRHDSNARNDPKILMLRAQYGPVGYAYYFMVIEMLREVHGYKIKNDKFLYAGIAVGAGISEKIAKEFIKKATDLGLLTLNTHLYSASLLGRMARLSLLQTERSEAGRAGGLASGQKKRTMAQANAKQNINENPSKRQAKGQANFKHREDSLDRVDRVEREEGETLPLPSLFEISAFAEAEHLNLDSAKFYNQYQSVGWMSGGQAIKDWKAMARKWSDEDNAKAAVGASAPAGGGLHRCHKNEKGEIIDDGPEY